VARAMAALIEAGGSVLIGTAPLSIRRTTCSRQGRDRGNPSIGRAQTLLVPAVSKHAVRISGDRLLPDREMPGGERGENNLRWRGRAAPPHGPPASPGRDRDLLCPALLLGEQAALHVGIASQRSTCGPPDRRRPRRPSGLAGDEQCLADDCLILPPSQHRGFVRARQGRSGQTGLSIGSAGLVQDSNGSGDFSRESGRRVCCGALPSGAITIAPIR